MNLDDAVVGAPIHRRFLKTRKANVGFALQCPSWPILRSDFLIDTLERHATHLPSTPEHFVESFISIEKRSSTPGDHLCKVIPSDFPATEPTMRTMVIQGIPAKQQIDKSRNVLNTTITHTACAPSRPTKIPTLLPSALLSNSSTYDLKHRAATTEA